MPTILIYLSAMALLGISSYFLLRKNFIEKTEKTVNTQGEAQSESEAEDLEKEESEPSHILEEAIILAAEDGRLSKGEEVMLRETAMQVGKDPDELIQQLREDLFGLEDAETNEIEAESNPGLTFEKYVFQLLNPKFFRLDHWAGDKFIAGRYASTDLDPDIQVTANTTEGRFPLAIECKWRTKWDGDYIWFAEDKQLRRYQQFSKETGKPTFIILGLGGKPDSPKEVYLIPVHAFKRGTQHRASLAHFRKPNPEVGFFFDAESGVIM